MSPDYIKAQLILLIAIVAAIAFVGCIYEISYGAPDFATTWAILLISLPVGVYSFVKAVSLARKSMQ
jgi:nitrogen fixation/metabolism regulation signal transduction histidine kinase